jgi:hypothetical protein
MGTPSDEEHAMSQGNWNPWKLTVIGLALVMITALVTGMVVANRTSTTNDSPSASPRMAAAPPAPPAVTPAVPPRPSQSVIEECNRVAVQRTTKDKTVEIVKDSAVAGLVGAAVGAAGGAIADGGSGAGKGAGIGGAVGLGAGALYGLNENRKTDERARTAYAACMRARGYGN